MIAVRSSLDAERSALFPLPRATSRPIATKEHVSPSRPAGRTTRVIETTADRQACADGALPAGTIAILPCRPAGRRTYTLHARAMDRHRPAPGRDPGWRERPGPRTARERRADGAGPHRRGLPRSPA